MGGYMAELMQFLGAVLIIAAVVVLVGPWQAAGLTGLALVAVGYLVERARPAARRPTHRSEEETP